MFKIRRKENRVLHIKEQITIVKNIIKYKQYNTQELCTCFSIELCKRGYRVNKSVYKIKYYIPLFCYRNALLHGKALIIIRNTKYKFWWSKYDSDKRLKFLEWMLNKLNKQINK